VLGSTPKSPCKLAGFRYLVIASGAKQFIVPPAEAWIASLRSQ
jgi:hypothetical protein